MEAGFESLGLSRELVAVTRELGYRETTPIQGRGIPVLLAGRDLIGQARTGSGKTAAFGLPILQKLDLNRRVPQALVLAPTRELCAQVAREIRKLGAGLPGLHVLIAAGGQPVRAQAASLRGGVHVVVGTPGRLVDLIHRRLIDLRTVTVAVLDEADRMLDMGFADEMDRVMSALPRRRQTALFSATFPPSIESIAAVHLGDPVRVTVDEPGEEMPEMRQRVVFAEPEEKTAALYRVLADHPHASALVFCHMKATVAEVAATLASAGVSVDELHGGLDQWDRDLVMAKFRNGSVRVLVATDVAARGLDVTDLDLVVNYDTPANPDVYVHRIGRTGRAGRVGVAVSLLAPENEYRLSAIEEQTGRPIERVPADPSDSRTVTDLKAAIAGDAPMTTIEIAGGRKDKIRPGDILGALTGDAGGLRGADVGRIEIHDRRAFVAVASRVARTAVRSLESGRIKGRRFRASLVGRGRRG